ncbi:NAD(P)-binding protein [Agrocybe pediades]|nr:NAD(P)-binding protein [Agrocybe pediades]
MARTWLVTGSSSGFGRAIVEAALKQGDRVIATLRKPSVLDDLVAKTSSEQLLVVKCDVSVASDIKNAFEQGVAKFGGMDIVFNNAGYAIFAEVESTPEDAARKMFDVNFWGASNVSREAVRVFRDVNAKGKVVAFPFLPYYSARSLEGLTEGLVQELDPTWNIKVTLLELDLFKTKSQDENLFKFPSIKPYAENAAFQGLRSGYEASVAPGDITKAARRVVEVSYLKDKKDAKIPLHWTMGKFATAQGPAKLRNTVKEMEDFESWSDNLMLNEEYKPLVL